MCATSRGRLTGRLGYEREGWMILQRSWALAALASEVIVDEVDEARACCSARVELAERITRERAGTMALLSERLELPR
jgi:hypothetical protein